MVDEKNDVVEEVVVSKEEAAMAAMAEVEKGLEQEEEQVEETVKTEEVEQVEEPKEKEESKTQLWNRITLQDKQIRELKGQLKNAVSIDQLRDVVKKDPGKVFSDLGISIEQVIDILAQQGGASAPTPRQEENTELSELKRELAEMKNMAKQQQQIALAQQEISHIDSTVKANPDRWEVIESMKSDGSYNLVLDTAHAYWEQTGEIPNYEIILDNVEEHLAAQEQARLQKLSAIKKFNKQPTVVAPVKKSLPSVNPNSPTSNPRRLTEEEKMAKVMALLNSDEE